MISKQNTKNTASWPLQKHPKKSREFFSSHCQTSIQLVKSQMFKLHLTSNGASNQQTQIPLALPCSSCTKIVCMNGNDWMYSNSGMCCNVVHLIVYQSYLHCEIPEVTAHHLLHINMHRNLLDSTHTKCSYWARACTDVISFIFWCFIPLYKTYDIHATYFIYSNYFFELHKKLGIMLFSHTVADP